jgi:hypothetical protein
MEKSVCQPTPFMKDAALLYTDSKHVGIFQGTVCRRRHRRVLKFNFKS